MALGGGGGAGAGAIKAGQAFVSIGTKNDGLTQGLKDAEKKLLGWGKTVASIGASIGALGGTVLAPITGAFAEMLHHFSDVRGAAARLGESTEVTSKLAYAAGGMDTLEEAAGHLQATIGKATPEIRKLLGELGLDAEELQGMKLEEQFLAISDALKQVGTQSQRAAVVRDLFGREAGAKLLPALTGDFRGKLQRGKELGEEVSTADAEKAGQVTKVLSDFWKAVKNTWREIGASLLAGADTFKTYVEAAIGVVNQVRAWLHENRQLVLTVAAVAAGVVAFGAAIAGVGAGLAAAGAAVGGLIAVLTAVKAAIAVILSPVGAAVLVVAGLTAAVVALGYVFFTSTETGRAWAAAIKSYFGETAENAMSAFSAIKNALLAGRLDLAWKVVTAALELEWRRLVLVLKEAWLKFIQTDFGKALGDVVYWAVQLWFKFAAGVKKVFIDMAAAVRNIFGDTFDDLFRVMSEHPILTRLFGGEALAQIAEAGNKLRQGGKPEEQKAAADKEAEDAAQAFHKAFMKAFDPAEQKKAVEDAKREIEEARQRFEQAKAEANAAAPERPGKIANPDKPPPVPKREEMAAAAAGAFQSGDFRQLLGGANDVAREQLAEIKGLRQDIRAGGGFL